MVSRGRKPPREGTPPVSLAQLVREALDRVASPEIRGHIIERALQRWGDASIRSEVGRLTAFVEGPLFEVVEEELGRAAASSVLESLVLAVERARGTAQVVSGVHERIELSSHVTLPELSSAPPASQSGAPPASSRRASVLVATDDDELAQLAQDALGEDGYRVWTCPGGPVALALCVRRRPSLVLASATASPDAGTELASLIALALGAEAPPVLLVVEEPTEVVHPDVAAVIPLPADPDDLLEALEPFLLGGFGSSRPA